ncbi:MAG: bifunctional 5,10-methylene-tetrahydrofolate dehydrogenase/5,10-methylene-tetrahydrofolate cyclohydrolase, partial [Chitinophagaceae bacterium]|nr:bifunctional 5,10-methylene-tetrahydrofolate dehydrogenase/5,10-methylene-tetrahydrofolate cyclohydrolase [Chitinophagaceae bacterium]
MKLLDGKLASQAIKEELRLLVAQRVAEGKKVPHLAAILIGNNGASATYVAAKVKACEETGFKSTLIKFEDTISEESLLAKINELNYDLDIDGILVQLPLPSHIAEEKIITAIDPEKDVDGFHPINLGRMVQGQASFIPATPYGIMLLLEHFKVDTTGKHAVVIGRSNIVGRPLSILLSANTKPGNCTVTLCHSKTKELSSHCQQADIIVAALGKAEFLKADMVKEGAIVIDVGITRVTDNTKKSGFRLLGDV